jgi:hypothetical protein
MKKIIWTKKICFILETETNLLKKNFPLKWSYDTHCFFAPLTVVEIERKKTPILTATDWNFHLVSFCLFYSF